MNKNTPYTYDAFISYRHTEPDKTVAERLHRILETYRIPKAIAKSTGKKRIQRVFRDRDELPTSSNLAENIQQALETSDHLIVVCSPRTPQSQWVIKEIETFGELHGHEKILALLIEGEPEESFPRELRFIKRKEILEDGTTRETMTEVEPLAADIRAASEKEMLKKLKTEVLRLLASMLNCRFDDLKQRHRERLIKTILTTSISLSAFFLAFGSFAAYQALIINQKSQEVSLKSQEVMQKNLEITKKSEELADQVRETQMAQSRYLADVSNRLYQEGDRVRAILVAQEALPKDLENPERPYVAEAEFALCQALDVYDTDSSYDVDKVLEHKQPVNYIDISPDHKTLVTSCRDGFIYTWNTEDGKLLGAFNTGEKYLEQNDIFFTKDNNIIVKCNDSVACSGPSGNLIWSASKANSDLAFISEYNILAYCGYEYRDGLIYILHIIDASSGTSLLEISLEGIFIERDGQDEDIRHITLSHDSSLVSLGTSLGRVLTLDTSTGELKSIITAENESITSLAYSAQGRLAVASYRYNENDLEYMTGCLEIYTSKNTEKPEKALYFPLSQIEKVKVNPYDPSLIYLVESEKLCIIDTNTGKTMFRFTHGNKVNHYTFTQDKNILATCSEDGFIRVFYSYDGYQNYFFNTYNSPGHRPIIGFAGGNDRLAIACRNSGTVYLYKPIINENTVFLKGHSGYVISGDIDNDGLALTFSETELLLWDIKNRRLLKSKTLDEPIREAVFVKNGILVNTSSRSISLSTKDLSVISEISRQYRYHHNYSLSLMAVDETDGITVYSLPDFKTVVRLENEIAGEFFFTRDDNLFVNNEYGRTIKLFDITTGNTIYSLDNISANAAAVSKDGSLCALSYKDEAAIKIFRMGSALTEIASIDQSVISKPRLLFSPDGGLLFVQYDDFSIYAYDAENGKLLKTFGSDKIEASLVRVESSRDGKRLALLTDYSNSLILEAQTLTTLAELKMHDIDGNFETILHSASNNVVIMPCYTAQMLLDEAKNVLNGRTLTPEERRDLFID